MFLIRVEELGLLKGNLISRHGKMKYIALLRGINVGNKNRIKMVDLVTIFESMGFREIKTYLQSGNVIFNYHASNTAKITGEIEKKLFSTFEYPVSVIIRTEDELEKVVNNNPFIKEDNVEIDKIHVTFLRDVLDASAVPNLDINKGEDEKFKIIGREIYLYLPAGYSRTKLTNNIFEKKLKTTATTRNWKTVTKLLEISKTSDLH
ncbi:MAG: DUF1697 domain-containing protein [Methanobacterium sp.]